MLPALLRFFARYPGIIVELQVREGTFDLAQDGIDVAIHNGPVLDGSLMARKLGATPIVTVGSPRYLERNGEPRRPSDLERHERIVYTSRGISWPWRFVSSRGEILHQPRGHLHTNDPEQIHAAVQAGLGLAHTPGWLFARELESGRVRRLLARYERPPLAISAIHADARRAPTKVRVFVEFLRETFAAVPSLAMLGG